MVRLSVNVNKIALLRNSRGGALPSVVQAARTCIAGRAVGNMRQPHHMSSLLVWATIAAVRLAARTQLHRSSRHASSHLRWLCVHPTRSGVCASTCLTTMWFNRKFGSGSGETGLTWIGLNSCLINDLQRGDAQAGQRGSASCCSALE